MALGIPSVLLVAVSLVHPAGATSPAAPWLRALIQLSFLVVFWAFAWGNPLRGWVSTLWLMGVVTFSALATRQANLLWMALELLGFGAVSFWGIRSHREEIQTCSLEADRLEGQINTLTEENRHLCELQASLQERRQRYNQLQHIANAFHLSLPLEELTDCIVQATGRMVGGADRVLLYLVNPKTLELELKAVGCKEGSLALEAKRGDPFDHWVMRQAQPLLVEDPQHDFRFSQASLQALGRTLGALVAVPLVGPHRFLGVLRLESILSKGMGPDTLRLVRIVGEMASLGVENSRLYTRMRELAITDDLTGLMVRSYFEEQVHAEMAQAQERGGRLAVLLIDIDRFKDYNDSFGHSAGDKLLRQMGRLLVHGRHPGDVVARFGGEEFVLLLSDADRGQAARQAEAIRSQIEIAAVTLRRAPTHVTASLGVAVFPDDGGTVQALLRTADERLYRAKSLGRNQVCCR